jgi:hypothetical protein
MKIQGVIGNVLSSCQNIIQKETQKNRIESIANPNDPSPILQTFIVASGTP